MVTITNLLEVLAAGIVSGGGIGLLLSRFSMTKKERTDSLFMLVKQLQENVNINNDEIKVLKEEIHNWRTKYYRELEQNNKLAEELH